MLCSRRDESIGNMNNMATLKDVAKRAKVSVSTVSYVLNKKKVVKPDTKQRILQAVEEVGYRPNQVARGLKTRRTYTLGVIVPDITNEFFTQIVRGIEDTADRDGYSTILCNTDNDAQKEKKYIETLMSKDIDGLIFIGTGETQDIAEENDAIPVVVVDRKLGNGLNFITVDNVRGGYMATDYLLGKKKSEVAFLTGALSIRTFFDRMTGYINALRDHGVKYNKLLIRECEFSTDGGYRALSGMIEEGVGIDSVFAANDFIALGAIRALMEQGRRIPEDISIVGFDDIALSSIYMPALTTIRQPKYEMGQKAAEIILEEIREKASGRKESKQIILEPSLVIRETT